jgi:hypothetical protein
MGDNQAKAEMIARMDARQAEIDAWQARMDARQARLVAFQARRDAWFPFQLLSAVFKDGFHTGKNGNGNALGTSPL